MTIVLQRETDDWVHAPVTVDAVDVIVGVSYAVVAHDARPVTFTGSVLRGARIGFKVVGLTVGFYDVYAKIVASPDTPVINLGTFQVA